ncbi:hypothetical protein EV426DRAFT_132799 [Tirmania nivea]|nr:hypothetical protein EV426DRAFT_132799 [Tirmania nivea]
MELNATQFLSDLFFDTPAPDSFLHKCWRLNTCSSCLDQHPTFSCGWCPYSNTCLPASSMFSPIYNPSICPLANERWELRTRTLGCNMSTRNILCIITTVIATLLVVGLLALIYAWWKMRERRRREWSLWESEPEGIWAWLGLESPFPAGWGAEGWGGWTRGWLLWRREEPQRIPGAWEDVEEGEGERRPLLR